MRIDLIGFHSTVVSGMIVPLRELIPVLITTLLFVLIGLAVFAVAFLIIEKVAPFSVRKELEEDQNIAIAIVIGSVILGSALIIAAAIHG